MRYFFCSEPVCHIGELETVKMTAWSRLTTPAPSGSPNGDRWLNVREAAAKLGTSVSYVYRHDFPFADREGRRLKFSERGIDAYVASKNGTLTPRRHGAILRPVD